MVVLRLSVVVLRCLILADSCAMARTLGLLVLAAVVALAAAGGSDVIELEPASFRSMLASDDIYFVEFYAPW